MKKILSKLWLMLRYKTLQVNQSQITLPFKLREIKGSDSYTESLVKVLFDEDEIGALNENNVVIEFGTPSGTHILYFPFDDLNILMEPAKQGWNAKRVYLLRFECNFYDDMKFLFKYPNELFGSNTFAGTDDEIIWTEHVKVFAKY